MENKQTGIMMSPQMEAQCKAVCDPATMVERGIPSYTIFNRKANYVIS